MKPFSIPSKIELINFLLPSIEYFVKTLQVSVDMEIEEIKQKLHYELFIDGKLLVIQKELDYIKAKWPDIVYYNTNRYGITGIADYLIDSFPKIIIKNFNRYRKRAQPFVSKENYSVEELILLQDYHMEKFNGYFEDVANQVQLITAINEYDFIKNQQKILNEQSKEKSISSKIGSSKIEVNEQTFVTNFDEQIDSEGIFLETFFKPENDILPPEDYLKYKNLLYSSQKIPIDIKSETWKILAVLLVLAVNDKLDLSEFNNVKKSKELNVKVSYFMSKYFTINGRKKDNTYFNSDIFPLITNKCGNKHRDFITRLDLVCGKLNFELPLKLK